MASPKTEWSVGAFILMGFACALVLAFAATNSAERMGGASYRVTANFTNAGDLKARLAALGYRSVASYQRARNLLDDGSGATPTASTSSATISSSSTMPRAAASAG